MERLRCSPRITGRLAETRASYGFWGKFGGHKKEKLVISTTFMLFYGVNQKTLVHGTLIQPILQVYSVLIRGN